MSGDFKRYFTGYLSSDWHLHPGPPYKGRGWFATLEYTEKCAHTRSYYDGRYIQTKEATLHSRSLDSARNAQDLINCAFLLYSGQPSFGEICELEPEAEEDRQKFCEEELAILAQSSCSTHGYPCACIIAARASHRKELQYALAKFRLSTLVYSHSMVDLDPTNHAYEHLGVSPSFAMHVQYAYSIIASYSVIEEIGLEIRASARKPSQIGKKWNQPVREDLEQRLKKAHVDLTEGISWIIRGRPTKLQKAKSLEVIRKPPLWNDLYVRDSFIDICDAIRYASYLRSTISSHKSQRDGNKFQSLTAIDSENVRHLARKLLLSRLGFWRYGGNPLEIDPPTFAPIRLDGELTPAEV